jgi:hypothetical protein
MQFIVSAAALVLVAGVGTTGARSADASSAMNAPTGTLLLNGTVTGVEQITPSVPDTGTKSTWQGAGTVDPLGHVTANGTNHAVGFIRTGTPTGTMVLTAADGSIDLALAYPQTAGFAPIPSSATYVITSGTGTYAGATGTGAVERELTPCSASADSTACSAPAATGVTYRFTTTGGTPPPPAPTSTCPSGSITLQAPASTGSAPRTVIRQFHLGGNPIPAAVDQRDHRVVVLDAACRRVTVLDSRDGHLIRRFALPGTATPTAAAADPSRHQFLIGATTPVKSTTPGPASVRAFLFVLDARTLAIVRRVADSTAPAPGAEPVAIEVDSRNHHVLVVHLDGTVITRAAANDRMLHQSATSAGVTGAAIDATTHTLAVAHGGGIIGGTTYSITLVNTTTGARMHRIALTSSGALQTATSVPMGETASMVGVDVSLGRVVALAHQPATGQWSIVELNVGSGAIVHRLALPAATGPGQITAALDTQLGRIDIALPAGSDGASSRILMLRAGDLTTVHSVAVNGSIDAMGVDIHAHRIFAVDGHTNLATVVDTWSGATVRTIRLGKTSSGTNAASVLISLRTHRAFIGEGNGQVTVLNSSLSR